MNRVIYACDVGSIPSGTFAWARVASGGGNPIASAHIDDLVMRLRQDMRTGVSIALGFESPLFMPIPKDSADLCRGRAGEGNRSMFAPAGAAVATLGVHEMAWILRAIRDRVGDAPTYILDWREWPPKEGTPRLFLWEAFVSGEAHGDSHEQDAATAVVYFSANEANLGAVNAVTADRPLSMVHAAAMWAGWANDLERLAHGSLVLRPTQAYGGPIDTA